MLALLGMEQDTVQALGLVPQTRRLALTLTSHPATLIPAVTAMMKKTKSPWLLMMAMSMSTMMMMMKLLPLHLSPAFQQGQAPS